MAAEQGEHVGIARRAARPAGTAAPARARTAGPTRRTRRRSRSPRTRGAAPRLPRRRARPARPGGRRPRARRRGRSRGPPRRRRWPRPPAVEPVDLDLRHHGPVGARVDDGRGHRGQHHDRAEPAGPGEGAGRRAGRPSSYAAPRRSGPTPGPTRSCCARAAPRTRVQAGQHDRGQACGRPEGRPGRAARRRSARSAPPRREPSTASASARLRCEQLGDPLLDGALGDEPVHLHRPGLADPVGAVGGLVLDGGVPPAVEVDDVVGAGQVEAGAAGLERQQEDRGVAGLEAGAPSARAARTGVPPCRNWCGIAGARRGARSSSRAIATYWVKTSTAPSSARIVPSSSSSRSSFSERPRSRAVGLLEEVGRVVADLLEAGEQRRAPARAGCPRRRARSAPSTRARAPRRAPPARGSARARWSVSVFGGQLGRDAGVGLAAAQQERADQLGELRAPWSARRPHSIGAGPDLAEGVAAAEQPGVAQSRIAQSSVRLFSTGVPVSATRRGARDRAQRLRAVDGARRS